MKLTSKLLGYLNRRVFDLNPYAGLALRLRYDGAMTWAVADGVLTTTVVGGSGVGLVVNLADHTIATLATALALQAGYSVPYADASEISAYSALALIDATGDQDQSNGDHLTAYTSLLWAWMDAQALELKTANDQIGQAVLQMSAVTAAGEWVDEHGTYYGVLRDQGEADAAYAARMISQVSRARGNNIAIAAAVKAATNGQSAAVTDVQVYSVATDGTKSFGLFDMEVDLDINTPLSFDQIDANARSVLEQTRDAGTHLRTLRYVWNVKEPVYAYAFAKVGITVTVVQGDGHTDWTNVAGITDPWVNGGAQQVEWFPQISI